LHSFVDEGVFCIINISFFCITLIKISVIWLLKNENFAFFGWQREYHLSIQQIFYM
jgi:hypothetical protein